MPNATQNYLHIPHKDWAPDDPRESENYREIERWARLVPFSTGGLAWTQVFSQIVTGTQSFASTAAQTVIFQTSASPFSRGSQITQTSSTQFQLVGTGLFTFAAHLQLQLGNTPAVNEQFDCNGVNSNPSIMDLTRSSSYRWTNLAGSALMNINWWGAINPTATPSSLSLTVTSQAGTTVSILAGRIIIGLLVS